MAAPLVVSFWMRALFTFVDTIYAATIGDAAVAAIGLSIPWEFLLIAVWVGLSTGLTSCLSRAMGEHAGEKIAQYLEVSRRLVLAAVPLFVAIGGALWFLAPVLSPDRAVAREFAIYATVLIAGSALSAFWSVIPDSVVKAHGDTRSTMWAGIWSNVVNVLLNTVFVFVFHWGIFGIALSTVLGRFAGLAYALHRASFHERARLARGDDTVAGLDARPYRSIFSLAVPSALAYTLMASESGIVNGLLARLETGQQAIAAYAIYYRVFQFAVMPGIATAVAMLPYAARRYGAKDIEGIGRGLREAHVAGLVYSALIAPIVWFAARPIATALGHAETTVAFSTFSLRVVPLAVVASLPFFLCRPAFEGMGRGRPGLVMASLRYVGLTAPAAWLGAQTASAVGRPGLYGLIVGLVGATAVTSLIFLAWMRSALRAARDEVAAV